MRKGVIVFVAMVGIAAFPRLGRAQFGGEGKLELAGFLGGMSLTQSLGSVENLYLTVAGQASDVGFGELKGLRASWAFTPNIVVEGNFSVGENTYAFDVDDGEIGNVSLADQFGADQVFWSGNVLFQYPLDIGLVPYGTAGFGQLRTMPINPISGIDDVTSNDFNVGGGVKYWLPPLSWLGFRFDVRYHTASEGLAFAAGSDSPTGTELTVGVNIRLF